MKTLILSGALVSAAALFGCSKEEASDALSDAGDAASEAVDHTKDALGDAKDAAFSARDAAYAKLSSGFEAAKSQFGNLEGLVSKAGDSVPADVQGTVETLREKIGSFGSDLEGLKGAPADAWEGMKSKLDGSLEEIKSLIADAMSKAKDMAPELPGGMKIPGTG